MKTVLMATSGGVVGLSIVLTVLLCSCEQVIGVDLNQAAPQVVSRRYRYRPTWSLFRYADQSGNYFEQSLYFRP